MTLVRIATFTLDGVKHFLAMHSNIGRRFHADPYLVTTYLHHRDHHIANDDSFFTLTR